ncbi:MAG: acetyl-CoA hydrolase [Acidimicrobiaceae bacterium]|nr:acetyl-CoA hydrolase [Acidimicrobiaceae bacterium]
MSRYESTTVSLDDAMALVPADAKVVAAPACGSPTTLLAGLAARSHAVPVTLYLGLQIDEYPFLDHVDPNRFRLVTWHVNGPLRTRVGDGIVEYVPARASQVDGLLDVWGIDVALVRVSPPDRNGFHSLGPTSSYALAAARRAAVVIAEVDREVPRTFGAWIHRSAISAIVDAEHPMPVYEAAVPDATSEQIGRRVVELLPRRPILQLGIGAIPEAITAGLLDADLGPLRFVGMVTDAVADLGAAGQLDPDGLYPDPAVLAAEVMGTRRVMDFVDGNPLVGVRESTISQHPAILGASERFVSINSAIEVDLTGQVNAESVQGSQISGIGGSIDYAETAHHSPGGLRVLAISATTADGRHSRIVPTIAAGDAVTHTRSSIDLVVTEHGVADLRGRTLAERREALLAISDPDFRSTLASDST